LFRFYLEQNIVAKRVLARERPRLLEMRKRFGPMLRYAERETEKGIDHQNLPPDTKPELRHGGAAGVVDAQKSTPQGDAILIASESSPHSPIASRHPSEMDDGEEIMSLASVRAVTLPAPPAFVATRLQRAMSVPTSTPGSGSAYARRQNSPSASPEGSDAATPAARAASSRDEVPPSTGSAAAGTDREFGGGGGAVHRSRSAVASSSSSYIGLSEDRRGMGPGNAGEPSLAVVGIDSAGEGGSDRRGSAADAVEDSEWENAVRDGMLRRRRRPELFGTARGSAPGASAGSYTPFQGRRPVAQHFSGG